MTNAKQPFTNARLMAVQAYYAKALSGESWDQVISRFLMEEIGDQFWWAIKKRW